MHQQQKDEAVMMALINIYNCMKGPHKKFDENSLENFKSRNRTEAEILIREFGNISTRIDWLTSLNDYANIEMIRNQRNTVFAILGVHQIRQKKHRHQNNRRPLFNTVQMLQLVFHQLYHYPYCEQHYVFHFCLHT